MDVTPIDSTYETNIIPMNDDVNAVQKYYAPFLLSNFQEYISTGTQFEPEKIRYRIHKNVIMYLLLKKPKGFNGRFLCYFFGYKRQENFITYGSDKSTH